ncbi:hypothetical protein BAUCODRAFT_149967 [Baudoinia panamericana UAMH 10762]|uniref:Uncharacterized protein n=1 Tax=Baudoinia panamericana (strain UAMH 10762) TaxID=717646 RepID=M2MTM5_BAUPA|nr:uncharacterized protein BAUCODRAFT_149967 [Baudoinia panamericana UAMH 10762]EMC94888.1 hypothetical protein BAUCODRAFT_149967 [Baudoinia panamericana UAMH 10762]
MLQQSALKSSTGLSRTSGKRLKASLTISFKSSKGHIVSSDDRFALLWQKRAEKLELRRSIGKETQATEFPDLYNEEKEKGWVRERYRLYLLGDGADYGGRFGQDDEEPEYFGRGVRAESNQENDGVQGHVAGRGRGHGGGQSRRTAIGDYLFDSQKEQRAAHGLRCLTSRDYEASSNDESQDEGSGKEDQGGKQEASAQRTFLPTAVACTRSFAVFHTGSEGLIKAGMQDTVSKSEIVVDEAQIAAVTATTPSSRAGVAFRVTRSWQFINGQMVEWPPVEKRTSTSLDECIANGKRKAEGEAATVAAAKKARSCRSSSGKLYAIMAAVTDLD